MVEEIEDPDVDLDEPTSFLEHVHPLVCTHCCGNDKPNEALLELEWQYKVPDCSNARISAGADWTMFILRAGQTLHDKNNGVVLWHGKAHMLEEMRWKIVWPWCKPHHFLSINNMVCKVSSVHAKRMKLLWDTSKRCSNHEILLEQLSSTMAGQTLFCKCLYGVVLWHWTDMLIYCGQ